MCLQPLPTPPPPQTVCVYSFFSDGEKLELLHPVPGIHVAMRSMRERRKNLFKVGPFARAISAREDIALRYATNTTTTTIFYVCTFLVSISNQLFRHNYYYNCVLHLDGVPISYFMFLFATGGSYSIFPKRATLPSPLVTWKCTNKHWRIWLNDMREKVPNLSTMNDNNKAAGPYIPL